GQGFRTDHQRLLVLTGADEGIGHAQRIDKTRTGRIDIESSATIGPESMLEQTGRRRENDVRRRRADDQQVNVGSGNASRFEGAGCRMKCEIAGGLAIRRLAPLADSRARAYPFVSGLDELLELLVGDDLFRQIAARARDA